MQNKEIEENIGRLKEFKEYAQEVINDMEYERPVDVTINQSEIYAIENTLQYIDQLENKVKELEKENNKLNRANKTYINLIQSITPVLLQDYIEKQVIRDKIEELKNHLKIAEENICDFNVTNYWHRQKLKFTHQIWALKELLEEE